MKRTQTLFALILMLSASPGLAWVGGPFSNDDYTGQGSQGTYQGTMRGHNTMGTMIFGSGNASESYGRFVVYHRGLVYRGSVQAIVDVKARYVMGNVFGQSVSNWAGQYDQEGVRTDDEDRPDVERRGRLETTTTTVVDGETGDITETTDIQEFDVFSVFATGEVAGHKNADGWFDCDIYETAPQLRFRGTGRLSFYAGFEATPTQYEQNGPFLDVQYPAPADENGIAVFSLGEIDFTSSIAFEPSDNEVVPVRVEGFRSSFDTPSMLVGEDTASATFQSGATIPVFTSPGIHTDSLQLFGG